MNTSNSKQTVTSTKEMVNPDEGAVAHLRGEMRKRSTRKVQAGSLLPLDTKQLRKFLTKSKVPDW